MSKTDNQGPVGPDFYFPLIRFKIRARYSVLGFPSCLQSFCASYPTLPDFPGFPVHI